MGFPLVEPLLLAPFSPSRNTQRSSNVIKRNWILLLLTPLSIGNYLVCIDQFYQSSASWHAHVLDTSDILASAAAASFFCPLQAGKAQELRESISVHSKALWSGLQKTPGASLNIEKGLKLESPVGPGKGQVFK